MDTLPKLPAIDIPLSNANPNSFPDPPVPRTTSTEPNSDTLLNHISRQSLNSITDLTTPPTPFSMKGGSQTTISNRSSSKYYVDDKNHKQRIQKTQPI